MDSAAPTLDQLVGDNIASHPQPSPEASRIVADMLSDGASSATSAAPSTGAPRPATGTRDSRGTPYDPMLHVTSDAAGGYVTARGTWRKRSKLASADSISADIDALDAPPSLDSATSAATPAVDFASMADAWTERFFTTCTVLLGDDWEPSAAQRRDVRGSTERWMRASNWSVDLPPGWALVMAVGMYALPRVALQSTRDRVGAIIGNLKSFAGYDDGAADDAQQERQAA